MCGFLLHVTYFCFSRFWSDRRIISIRCVPGDLFSDGNQWTMEVPPHACRCPAQPSFRWAGRMLCKFQHIWCSVYPLVALSLLTCVFFQSKLLWSLHMFLSCLSTYMQCSVWSYVVLSLLRCVSSWHRHRAKCTHVLYLAYMYVVFPFYIPILFSLHTCGVQATCI